ncbi:MAG: alpha/beta hydrolase family protein [Vicinamibacterales bacterium]
MRLCAAVVVAAIVTATSSLGAPSGYRTLDDRFAPPQYASADAWNARAAYLREHVLASAGLLPLPEKTPLRPTVFGEVRRADYSVSKVFFESLPGFFVTGNLYRPPGDGPFPAVLSPHGHFAYGRLENTVINSVPGRAINLARQGFVVFTYDMIGYNDSQQVPHTFSGPREYLWGLSLSGLQLWDSIRAVDFVESLPYVRRDAIGMTGESGGATQTFLASAVDRRIAVSVPVNMISLHMQGGCLCENPPGLRLETNNLEIAATIAPRPLLMISATGDWTAETLELEYPAMRALYNLVDASDRVRAVRITAPHNYNQESREAMYAWMARWLQHAPEDTRRAERPFTPESLQNLLVFYQRALPAQAVDVAGLTGEWIDAAKRQLAASGSSAFTGTLRHVLGFAADRDVPPRRESQEIVETKKLDRTVLISASHPELERALTSGGLEPTVISLTTFDGEAASKVHHFETYNRTPSSQLVADIVAAVRAHPGAALVADGDAALAAVLANAVVPIRLAVLDVGGFDTSSDQAFLDHLYIPGLRRAGDLRTAAAMSRGQIVVHNAGHTFDVPALRPRIEKLTAAEIVAILGKSPSNRERAY